MIATLAGHAVRAIIAALLCWTQGVAFQSVRPPFQIEAIGQPPESTIEGVQFSNAEVGWAMSPRQLWRTVNGGKNWDEIPLPTCREDSREISAVRLLKESEGYMLMCNQAFITSDAGLTWKSFPLPFVNDGDIHALWLEPDHGRAWAGGMQLRRTEEWRGPNWAYRDVRGFLEVSTPVLFRTADGGRTWDPTESIHASQLIIRKLWFLSEDVGFAAGYTDLYRTTDSGVSWQPFIYPQGCVNGAFRTRDGEPLDLFFVDKLHGWLSFDDGRVLRTTDSGATWCEISDPKKPRSMGLIQMRFFSPLEGVAIAEPARLATTQDGGVSWQIIPLDRFVRAIFFLDKHAGWIVTDKYVYRAVR